MSLGPISIMISDLLFPWFSFLFTVKIASIVLRASCHGKFNVVVLPFFFTFSLWRAPISLYLSSSFVQLPFNCYSDAKPRVSKHWLFQLDPFLPLIFFFITCYSLPTANIPRKTVGPVLIPSHSTLWHFPFSNFIQPAFLSQVSTLYRTYSCLRHHYQPLWLTLMSLQVPTQLKEK